MTRNLADAKTSPAPAVRENEKKKKHCRKSLTVIFAFKILAIFFFFSFPKNIKRQIKIGFSERRTHDDGNGDW